MYPFAMEKCDPFLGSMWDFVPVKAEWFLLLSHESYSRLALTGNIADNFIMGSN